ncbi:hypothetical protein FKM82_005228 [Ascaphus truei]
MDTVWIWLCFFLQVAWTSPVSSRRSNGHMLERNQVERTREPNNLVKGRRTENHNRERLETSLDRVGAGRWSTGQDLLRYHRTQCIHMSQPWTHGQDAVRNQDPSSVFLFSVFTGSLKPIFPQQNLFQYISRIYRCCKLGFTCRKIKGLQGTIEVGDRRKEMEFYVDLDITNLSILRAELHLEVSNSDGLTVIPVLRAKGTPHSRYLQLIRNRVSDLTLDVMFLFKMLKETQDVMSEDVTELSLALHCIRNEHPVPCDLNGVSLLHHPFIALQYE